MIGRVGKDDDDNALVGKDDEANALVGKNDDDANDLVGKDDDDASALVGKDVKLSIGFFLSFDNIDNKVKNQVKIDLSNKIR